MTGSVFTEGAVGLTHVHMCLFALDINLILVLLTEMVERALEVKFIK